MASSNKKLRDARRKYVFERQAIPTIAVSLGVSQSTVRRWKKAAKANGDDWDIGRSANMLSGESMEAIVTNVLERFIIQFEATISDLEADKNIGAADRAKILQGLGDAFAKTISSAARVAPKISEMGVANDVVRRLTNFVGENYPHHSDAFLEILEPFGDHLIEVYG